MSSAHEVAEHGRKSSASEEDEEEEKDLLAEVQGQESHTIRASEIASATDADGGRDKNGAQHTPIVHNDLSSIEDSDDGQKRAIKPNGVDVLSAAVERPSSADGSLSIPDDTPSIQVGHNSNNGTAAN